MRKLLIAGTLFWASLGLFLALLIVLPAPHIALWFVAILVEEASLLLAAFALAGLVLAGLAHRAGARNVALVAAVFGVVTVGLSLVPVVQGVRTATAENVSLSFSAYFAKPAFIAEGKPETVTYARVEDQDLKLDIWRSPENGDSSAGRPAVIIVHGGSWEWGTRSETPRWDEWLAELGYIVFDIDYRLMPPPRWQDAPGDVKCAVGWVRGNAERFGVDPERIALMGYSSGAHLALLAAYSEDESELSPSCEVEDTEVAAVVAFSPVTDLQRAYTMAWSWWKPDIVGVGDLEQFLGGTPDDVPERYGLASPTSHIDVDDPPTFLVHGEADQIVPLEQADLLAAQLEDSAVPYRFVKLPGVDHGFEFIWWGGWSSQVTRPVLEEFLERYL